MTNLATSADVIQNLYGLTIGYHCLYTSLVTKTIGPLKKRHRAEKLMVKKCVSNEICLVDDNIKEIVFDWYKG